MDIREIPISDIVVGERSQELDDAWVSALASMIEHEGLINPITVWDDEGVIRLAAGNHRLAAIIQNGQKAISAHFSNAKSFEEAKIIEVAENIARKELNAYGRARHLFDLMSAQEKLHPQLKKGGDKQTDEGRENLTAILAVRLEIADKVGLSDRSIRRDVAVWKGLTPASRETVKATWLADHQAGLQQLSAQSPKVQKKVCDLLFSKPPKATNVTDALTIITDGRLATDIEKKFVSINKALDGLKEKQLHNVFAKHEAKIMAWLDSRESK